VDAWCVFFAFLARRLGSSARLGIGGACQPPGAFAAGAALAVGFQDVAAKRVAPL
jgi:hypothetical protein